MNTTALIYSMQCALAMCNYLNTVSKILMMTHGQGESSLGLLPELALVLGRLKHGLVRHTLNDHMPECRSEQSCSNTTTLTKEWELMLRESYLAICIPDS